MAEGRGLGLGLVVLGGVLGGLTLLWMIVSLVGGQLSPGGFVLGLLIASILGLIPGGLGVWILMRQRVEAAQETAFAGRRTLMESDRLLRHDLQRDLSQLASRLVAVDGNLARRARDLSEDVGSPGYDQPGWYEAVDLSAADRSALERYETLATDAARRLETATSALEARDGHAEAVAAAAMADLERNWSQRAALLRGRRPSAVEAGALLEARGESSDDLTAIEPGDGISREDVDYLVETSASYFMDGRTSWIHRLVAEREERWLFVGPGALELIWLEATPVPAGLAEAGGTATGYELEESGTAAVTVTSRDERTKQRGARETVRRWRYRGADGQVLLVERWSDGPRAFAGSRIRASDLERWPSGRGATPPTA